MAHPLSTEDGKIPLFQELERGATSAMWGDDKEKTTIRLDWSNSFKRDMRDLGKNNNFWSRTECEVVVMHHAVKEAKEVVNKSPLKWAQPIDNLHDAVEYRTHEYRRIGSEIDRFTKAVGGLDLDVDDTVEYTPAIGRKTTKKLSTKKDYTGVTKKSMIKIGIAKVIMDNTDLFRHNTEQQAEVAINDAKSWFNNSEDIANSAIDNIATLLKDAVDEGTIVEKRYKDQMAYIQENHPGLYGKLVKPFNGDPVV